MNKLIEKLIDKIDKIVFWTCPNGCNDFVDWNDNCTEATCRKCGAKSTDQITTC